MLNHGAALALWITLSLLQAGLAELERCNFTLLESKVSSLSASIQWRTLGSPCNFSLIYNSDTSGPAWCHPIRIDNVTYGCNPEDLQAGTIYNFRIVSLDGEERALVLQTDPLPPARFEVNPKKTTSTTLQVRWTPSSGKVTWYEVQLLDDDSQKLQEVQVQESNPWSQYTFLNLTAGSNYRIAVMAVSGEKRSFPVYTNGSTVPSPVKDIGISPSPNSLQISWSRGSGNVEQYRLVLMDKGTLVQDRTVDKHDSSYAFHGLTPGHLYNLTIITMASGLQNYRWKPVRTAPMEVSDLKVTNNGSPTSLKVKWQKPPGDVDSYNITLSYQGTIDESKTLAPRVTETQFKDLVPGRLYQVTISCISGELSAQKMTMGRTVPEKVRNLVSYNEIWMKSFAVNWTPPAGDWEHYRILLFNDSLALLNATVGKEEAHFVMDGVELIPGRQYEVEVIVESGNLRNSERCRGRTDHTLPKTCLLNFQV